MLWKKEGKKKIRIKVCPICGSRNIHLSSSFDGWLTPEIYVCENCGYRGPIILEIEIDKEQLEK